MLNKEKCFLKMNKEKWNNIFWDNNIVFFESEKDINNWYSVIIWENWIWKSTFLDELINTDLKVDKKLFITFSLFDSVWISKNDNFIYKGPKSITNWMNKKWIYNVSKYDILTALQVNENKYIESLKYIFNNKSNNIKIRLKFYKKDNFFDFYDKINDDDLRIKFFQEIIDFNSLKEINENKKVFYYKDIDLKEYIELKSKFDVFFSENTLNYVENEKEKDKSVKDNNESYFINEEKLYKWVMNHKVSITWSNFEKFLYYSERIRKNDENAFIDLDILFDDKSLSSSSSGELIFIYSISYLLSNLTNLDEKVNDKFTKIVLIDEPEISLHPSWQKKYIDTLKDIVNNLGINNTLFVLTTHSPLLVLWIKSDLNTKIVKFEKDEKDKTESFFIEHINNFSVDDILLEEFNFEIRDSDITASVNKIIIDNQNNIIEEIKIWEKIYKIASNDPILSILKYNDLKRKITELWKQ